MLMLLGWGTLFNEAARRETEKIQKSTNMDLQSVTIKETVRRRNENTYKEKSEEKVTKQQEPQIRVLLTRSDYNNYVHEEVSGICNGKEFVYTVASTQIQGKKLVLDGGKDGIMITSIERQDGHPVYYGKLEIIKTKEGLNLINELSLEQYLESVVPSEMPASYAIEALMAQAVCARTYAWKHIQGEGVTGYEADVDDSVNYQVYGNVRPEKSTNLAVKKTDGQIMLKGGEPIEAYYFSTSAGVTSTDEIWGAEVPADYLKSVPCDFDKDSPWRKWEVTISWTKIQEKVKSFFGDDSGVNTVEVVKKNKSGAVTCLRVVTEKDIYEIKQEYPIRQFLAPEGCMITEKNGKKSEGGYLLPSAYFKLLIQKEKNVKIIGGGYGHGVGMSQNGAAGMAEQGYTWKEILEYFFDEITIKKMY